MKEVEGVERLAYEYEQPPVAVENDKPETFTGAFSRRICRLL